MRLEDRVLELLGRASSTYDGLRGSLGCLSGDLDAAIRTLERAQSIYRERGRFHLVGEAASKPQAAEATQTGERATMTKRTCSVCHEDKEPDAFPKKGAQCKACISAKAKVAYAAKHKGVKPRGQKRIAAKAATNGGGGILDGLRAHREKLQRSIDIVDQAIALLEADA